MICCVSDVKLLDIIGTLAESLMVVLDMYWGILVVNRGVVTDVLNVPR